MPSPEKTKFGNRATKDDKSICNSDKNKFKNYSHRYNSYFLLLFYYFFDIDGLLQVKGDAEKPSISERETR